MKLYSSHGIKKFLNDKPTFIWDKSCLEFVKSQTVNGIELPSEGIVLSLAGLKGRLQELSLIGLKILLKDEAKQGVIFDNVLFYRTGMGNRFCAKGLIFTKDGVPVHFKNFTLKTLASQKVGASICDLFSICRAYKWTNIPVWGQLVVDPIEDLLSLGDGSHYSSSMVEAAEPAAAPVPMPKPATIEPQQAPKAYIEFASYPDALQFDIPAGWIAPQKGEKILGLTVQKVMEGNGDTNCHGKNVQCYIVTGKGKSARYYACV